MKYCTLTNEAILRYFKDIKSSYKFGRYLALTTLNATIVALSYLATTANRDYCRFCTCVLMVDPETHGKFGRLLDLSYTYCNWVKVSCAFEISAISLEKFSSKVKNSDVKIKYFPYLPTH